MIRERFLAVRGESFDIASVRADIDDIAADFGEYLSQVGAGGRSKHRALGAVGKALQHARIANGAALLGYARRVHEQTTDNTFPAGAVEKLDEGLKKLDRLLSRDDVPGRAKVVILERIEYATYYDVRRRFVEFQRGWRAFVRAAVETSLIGAVADDAVPWFSRAKLKNQGDPWVQLGEAYLKSLKTAAPVVVDEDEEE